MDKSKNTSQTPILPIAPIHPLQVFPSLTKTKSSPLPYNISLPKNVLILDRVRFDFDLHTVQSLPPPDFLSKTPENLPALRKLHLYFYTPNLHSIYMENLLPSDSYTLFHSLLQTAHIAHR